MDTPEQNESATPEAPLAEGAMESPMAEPPAPAMGPSAAPPPVPPQTYGTTTPPPPPTTWEAPAEEAGPAPGYAFGGPGERLVAYIVDTLLVGLAVVVAIVVGALIALVTPVIGILIAIIAALVVGIGYFPYFWARSGQTPGLRLFGLYVVRDRDGGPVSAGAAVLRLVGYWIDGLVFYLGFVWILIDKRKRGWHDLIAGTVVVKKV